MEYFPHLELGVTQTRISLIGAALCFVLIFGLLCIKTKFRRRWGICLAAAFLLTIPSCMVVERTIGYTVFTRYHFAHNRHMPKNAEVIDYQPFYSYLKAKYHIKRDALDEWVKKYRLEEDPENTFSSKIRANGQGLEAVYNPTEEVLTIRYSAF